MEVIKTQEEVLGPNHPDTLKTKGSYAITLKNLNRYKEAEKLELEVMKAQEEVLGPNHPDTLWTKNNYAVTLKNLNRYKEAEKL